MRVLHVEDNAMDADLVRRALLRQAPDLELSQVATLAAAKACLNGAPTPDAALLDIKLPDGSGLELLAWIREQRLSLAVVMLTGSGDHSAAVAALQAGADDYLAKDEAARSRLATILRDAVHRFEDGQARRAHPLRVLYAEHSAADVDLTRRHLARHAPHIRLTVASDAEQALARLPMDAHTPPDYDVVLLDYRLPGLDALDAVKALRAERGLDLPIVIVTGQGSEEVAAHAIRLGVDDYITKHAGYLFELPPTLEKVHRQAELTRERGNLRRIAQRLAEALDTSPVILYTLRLTEDGAFPTWVSSNIHRLLGFSEAEALRPEWWLNQVHPDDRDWILANQAVLRETGHLAHEYRLLDRSGRMHWIQDELRLSNEGEGQETVVIGAWRDITDAKETEQLRETRIAVLDGLNADCGLNALLDEIARRLEKVRPEMRVSILVCDPRDGRLYTGAAPSLPDFYNSAMDGLVPAAGNGSCGAAAATGETVIVRDIRDHPYWDAFRELGERAGLRACWSIPFKDSNGRVLGTFAIYHNEPSEPTRAELDLIGEFARLSSLAVQRVRADTRLRQMAAVFENTREGVIITDLTPRILGVNRAYTEITGYPEEEVLGCNPSLLKSGHQDPMFYQAMWQSIHETGHWQGEIWNRHRSGEIYPQLLTVSTVRDGDGRPTHYVGVMTDISQLKQSEERLERLAHYDPLTDLPNRLLLLSRLEHVLERAERYRHKAAVLFIDVDNFKVINDSLGHPVGDALLSALARRLRDRLRDEDTLGRLGGDEFLVVLEDLERVEDATTVAEVLIGLLEQSFVLPSGEEIHIGASIGISLYPDDGGTVTELIKNADTAMYQAKGQGRNTYRFYTASLSAAANHRLALEARLRRALANDEFVLYYQPQIDTNTHDLIGCEALLRWLSPEDGLVPPDRFIPLAEETGLILPLGEWVLRHACIQIKAWLDAGFPPLVLAVNLSARQLRQTDLVDRVAAILQDTGLPPDYLRLELTESMLMEQGDQALAQLQALQDLNLKLSIDDFGTGYSSLAYLKLLPIDELKIDRSFVRDIPEDSNDMEITATIIAIARNLKLRVVAEGVETQEQLDFLKRQGCHAWQGYLFSRPIPAAEFARSFF
ncbi:MAG: EAL domain-containing protein [Candidatus Competibacteraceae bacterium]|nr:MAG: EAL domain-containing protein [Candidatus Competibacteraceae bacterium]